MTFHRIKAIEAEIAQIHSQNQNKQSPEIIKPSEVSSESKSFFSKSLSGQHHSSFRSQ